MIVLNMLINSSNFMEIVHHTHIWLELYLLEIYFGYSVLYLDSYLLMLKIHIKFIGNEYIFNRFYILLLWVLITRIVVYSVIAYKMNKEIFV